MTRLCFITKPPSTDPPGVGGVNLWVHGQVSVNAGT